MNTRLTGISSMATRQVLDDATGLWRRRGGNVSFDSVGGVEAAKRLQGGEAFDVVVLAAAAIDKLVATGRVLAHGKIDLALSSVAIAVRQGAAQPAVATERDLREAVLSADTIGYSTGPSGVALLEIFERWGITERVRPRLIQAAPGVSVGTLIARGDVALGFQQLSELAGLDSVAVIGSMPPGLEIVTTFSGAICATSMQADAARALLAFLHSPAADEAKRRYGMQPA